MKTLFKILLLFFTIGFFQSCEKDNFSKESEIALSNHEITNKRLNLDEIPNFKNVNAIIKKLDKKLNSNTLFKSSDFDGVTILTDDIIYMTYANSHTYTLQLVRSNPDYYIENIVLHYNVETSSYDEYLLQYDVTASEFIDIHQNIMTNQNLPIILTKLNKGTIVEVINKSDCSRSCQVTTTNCAGAGSHGFNEYLNGDCSYELNSDMGIQVYQTCSISCDNPPETIDDGGNTGGGNTGGGGSSPSDGDVITNPNPSEPSDPGDGTIGLIGPNGCITNIGDNEILQLLPKTPVQTLKLY